MPSLSPQVTPYYGGGQVVSPVDSFQTSGAPSSANISHNLGTLAIDNAAGAIYGLASKSGGTATWVALGGGTVAVQTETGDTGTATPSGGNIKHAGTANQITTAASGATVTYTLPSAIITPGTIAINGMTEGSVLFAGASSVVSQNNVKFFFDNTDHSLGIGINPPFSKLHINSDVGAAALTIGSGDGGANNEMIQFKTSYSGNKEPNGLVAQIIGAPENQGGRIIFFTGTDDNPSALGEAARINSDNTFCIGSTLNPGLLNVGTAAQFVVSDTGVVTAGSWNGTEVDVAHGGTGATSFNTNGAIISNTTGTGVLAAVSLANQALLAGNTSAAPTAKSLSINVQTFTANGTYTPTSGMLYCIIECLGCGGGGGGTADTGAGVLSYGGGGGAGSYSRKFASAATIGASQAVTVGTGGAGGTAGANNGTAGGDASVGVICVGKGGSGGIGSAASGSASGGAGGVAGTGDFTVVGQPGWSSYAGTSLQTTGLQGIGGSSLYGHAGIPPLNPTASTGTAGQSYGSGGSGGGSYNAGGAAAGGAGAVGIVIVTEIVLS